MTAPPSLSQQCLHAINLMFHPSLLSQWTLRITLITALFAFLQAISEISSAPALFIWCNLCICLWMFNTYCTDLQHTYLYSKPLSHKQPERSFAICAFPVVWAMLFFVLFGCFVLLDWIPYVGTVLSVLLTPLFFLLAAVPPLGVLVQLALPIFVFPYLQPQTGGIFLLVSSFQFIQQPARTLSFFLLAYAPLALMLLVLWGSWETVYMMNRFSSYWPISLLQKSLLIILSGVCLGPPTLFLSLMGMLPALSTPSPKRTKTNFERERAQWFMSGES